MQKTGHYSLEKFFLFFISACAFLCIVSCKSSSMPVPFEEGERIENIYREYYSIAQSYEKLKNYDKAISYYKLAMNDKTFRETSYYRIGYCYAMAKDWDNALVYYEPLLKVDSDNASLKLSAAYIHAMKGELDKACSYYEEAVSKTSDESVYKNYLSVLIASEKYERATEVLELLKTDFPDSTSIKTFSSKLEEYEKTKKKDDESPKDSEASKAAGETTPAATETSESAAKEETSDGTATSAS